MADGRNTPTRLLRLSLLEKLNEPEAIFVVAVFYAHAHADAREETWLKASHWFCKSYISQSSYQYQSTSTISVTLPASTNSKLRPDSSPDESVGTVPLIMFASKLKGDLQVSSPHTALDYINLLASPPSFSVPLRLLNVVQSSITLSPEPFLPRPPWCWLHSGTSRIVILTLRGNWPSRKSPTWCVVGFPCMEM